MPEHLKALVVVLGIALPVFAIARGPLTAALIAPEDYSRRRNAWLLITLVLFLAHNYWLYVIGCGALMVWFVRHEHNGAALYAAILFAAPPLKWIVPGFGPIDAIMPIDYYRMLSMFLLLPIAIRLARAGSQRTSTWHGVDGLVIAFLAWRWLRDAPEQSVINVGREALYAIIDIWLPYYVGSRALDSLKALREFQATLLLFLTVVGAIAIFEFVRSWQLYEGLWQPLGISFPAFSAYQAREGFVRASVTANSPIVLGYMLMVGAGALLYIAPELRPRWRVWLSGAAIVGGVVVSLSRGPWVGAGVVVIAYFMLQPDVLRRFVKPALGFTLVLALIAASPLGRFLPFIGSAETGSIDYRTRLLEVCWTVLQQNPLVGDPGFLDNPLMEQMRQGQGLIDMVNSYLQVVMPYGLIGLALYLACFVVTLYQLNRARRTVSRVDPERERIARNLLAIVLGIIVTIATVSSINGIPYIYWSLLGVCVGCTRLLSRTESSAAPVSVRPRAEPRASLPPRPGIRGLPQ